MPATLSRRPAQTRSIYVGAYARDDGLRDLAAAPAGVLPTAAITDPRCQSGRIGKQVTEDQGR